MNKFKELMVQAEDRTVVLTVEEQTFVETHKQIISFGNLAGRSIVELARKLKEMRDGKSYKVAGFKNFASYVETAVGIKERQAYNYIKAVESFDAKYLAENADLGITKLALLASVTEEEREEIESNIDVKTANVPAVEEAVKKAIQERDEAKNQLELIEGELSSVKQEKDAAESARDDIQKAYAEKKRDLQEARTQLKSLEAAKKELEAKLKETKEPEVRVETVTVVDEAAKTEAEEQRKRADELAEQLRKTNIQLEEAKAQKKKIASDELLTFKIKFDDVQKTFEECLNLVGKMDEKSAVNCRKALAAVTAKWTEVLSK